MGGLASEYGVLYYFDVPTVPYRFHKLCLWMPLTNKVRTELQMYPPTFDTKYAHIRPAEKNMGSVPITMPADVYNYVSYNDSVFTSKGDVLVKNEQR